MRITALERDLAHLADRLIALVPALRRSTDPVDAGAGGITMRAHASGHVQVGRDQIINRPDRDDSPA